MSLSVNVFSHLDVHFNCIMPPSLKLGGGGAQAPCPLMSKPVYLVILYQFISTILSMYLFIHKRQCQQTSLRYKNWDAMKLKYRNHISCPYM